jgi:hypothetical protein
MRARPAGGMNASPKLHKAGRAFLLPLVSENGIDEAVTVLRDLADELEGLAKGETDPGEWLRGGPFHTDA